VPVYHLTIHTYGSWQEDHPKGYVQRGEGLKPSSTGLAKYRDKIQRHPSVELSETLQSVLARGIRRSVQRAELRGHALVTNPNHAHVIVSFPEPMCTCRPSLTKRAVWASDCGPGCPARGRADAFIGGTKKHCGSRLAVASGTSGRPYLSRGWNRKRVRDREHFKYLVAVYLPKHIQQNGSFYDETWLASEA
jgi:hypothetical protein